MRVQK